ncbi:MAG: acyltransferase domain-containing protein, partial [Rhodobacterales bacterium]|nr:acyltransferase domain-containing protein [Rhodobacterales bacterium]
MSAGVPLSPIVLAANPPGLPRAGLAIAAARAGHIGLLNLELVDPAGPVARRELARLTAALSGGCAGQWGLKCELAALPALAAALGAVRPDLVVVTEAEPEALARLWPDLAARWPGCRLLVEIREATDIARRVPALVAAGAQGFVVKGFEAGGPVGTETTYLLLQWLRRLTDLPVHAQGGIAPDTAAAVLAAGAAGVVLDWQLALFEAAELPARLTQALAAMDGSETRALGLDLGLGVRSYWRADHAPARALDALERELNVDGQPGAEAQAQFLAALRAAVAVEPAEQALWLVGQDAAFAARFRAGHARLGAALDALQRAAAEQLALAARQRTLAADAPLARALGTRYPVVQGPMTRVSDRAEFALAVAQGGALPFLALALMRGPEASALVAETRALLGDLSWGIGILGFVDDDLRAEQTRVILDHRPRYALIAGGRPDQALALEQAGIATFLHVPSPGLLKLFLESGTRRFIFEGHECGGHVGPRTSFVLWQQAVDVLLDSYPPGSEMDVDLLFAGGIHDAVSAAMVAALAARLVARGARVGVLVGTGYLFTAEAVAAGAIQQSYQDLVLQAQETVLLESGPGHMTRVVDSPIVAEFRAEKARLQREGLTGAELRDRLEQFNIGRSRIASKGIDRNPARATDPAAPRFVQIAPADQLRLGVYMTGQAAGLHDRPTTIAALHDSLCDQSVAHLAAQVPAPAPAAPQAEGPGVGIAITGVATILPKAANAAQYWQNILDKVDAIEEVPARRWDWRRYYDADRDAPDRIYSKWGGFLDEMEFDPLRYGIPPTSLPQIEPLQLLALEAVRQALEDAGYPGGVIPDPGLRKRTSVIIGVGGGAGPLGQKYAVRSALPAVEGRVSDTAAARLPDWTEDSFPGILLNVIAGRVANRFDLGGVNFTVDAACGSSLAAVMMAARELETGTSDMVIVGGVDSFQNPFDFLAFSKTRALSPRGRCRTFDATADGIAISEGLALVVLRRLADAEAEGGRIYAVLRGVAGSSDGRDLSLTAPRAEGQQEALRRAYAHAGISPATVGMVEAHGTGTVVGDRTEIQSLSRVFADNRADRQFCGVGSVKSMIGHTKAAAGCAGLIKMALALHHRVQPATLNVTDPNPSANFAESPFYVQTEARPWLRTGDTPRRAGVSAFGFGGTNFHAVLEEYQGGYLASHQEPFRRDWVDEVFLFSAADAGALAQALDRAGAGLAAAPASIRLADVAASLAQRFDPAAPARAALVAAVADRAALADRLGQIAAQLRSAPLAADGVPRRIDPRGSFLALGPALTPDQVALLFPGQGSQYPGMAAGLAMHFPLVRDTIEDASRWLAGRTPEPLAALIHPIPTLDAQVAAAQAAALTRTDVAQPAIGAVSLAVLRLLRSLGLQAGAHVGHSFGEYTALHAAGAFDAETLVHLAHARGDAILQTVAEGNADLGTMSAIGADAARVRAALGEDPAVVLANLNAPDQTVIAGPTAAVAAAGDRLRAAGLNVQPLPVACGFHSPCVAPARDRLAAALAGAAISAPGLPVYGNATAAPYPAAADQVRAQLADHLVSPVDFVASVQAMHAAGARLFLEVGPNGVLSRLVDRCLAGRDGVLALASDSKGKAGIGPFLALIAGAAAAGLPLTLGALWARRARTDLDVTGWDLARSLPARPPVVWMIDAATVRPLGGQVAKAGFATPIEQDAAPAPAPAPVAMPAPVVAPVATPVPVQAAVAVPAAPGIDPAAADFALRRHQELMTRFLDSSREVMLAYLGQSAPPAAR